MLYLVIERFKEGAAPRDLSTLPRKGPDDARRLDYLSSWIRFRFQNSAAAHCKTEDFALFDQWIG